jgi:thymidine phosphorylase
MRRAADALSDGSALERFRAMVAAQGGDPRAVDDPLAVLPRAPVVIAIGSDRDGVLAAVDAEEIGSASAGLGAGRMRKGEPIDPAVGIVMRPKIGDRLEAGAPIGEVHARDRDSADAAAARVLGALTVADAAVEPPPLVHEWMG